MNQNDKTPRQQYDDAYRAVRIITKPGISAEASDRAAWVTNTRAPQKAQQAAVISWGLRDQRK